MALCTALAAGAQDGLNQVIVLNGGQFGNPAQRANLALFDPLTGEYAVFDTLPSNSVQHLLISGDTAYVAAQNYLAMYDLDSYERLALSEFPGLSAHQLLLWGDYLFATNFYGQDSSNLYAFDRRSLSVTDTIAEITHAGGTMAVAGGMLYVSQNRKGSTDACPPFGCLNDTLGYLSVVDPAARQWVENIELSNDGNECGRLLNSGGVLVSLNETSQTITAYQVASGTSLTLPAPAAITTSRYRTEASVIDGRVVALFDGGIGILSEDLLSAEMLVDTPVVAFAYDGPGNQFFSTYTDFFTTDAGYVHDANGVFQRSMPVGFAPEAVAVHYNRQPVGSDLEVASADTLYFDVADIATDPDGDDLEAVRIVEAPASGILTLLAGGGMRYVSLSPGSADAFRVEVCDDKRNPLCSFINVEVLPVTAAVAGSLDPVRVFPNPTNGPLHLVHWPAGARASIYNSLGVVVRDGLTGSGADLSGLPAATYYLRLEHSGETRLMPVVKF